MTMKGTVRYPGYLTGGLTKAKGPKSPRSKQIKIKREEELKKLQRKKEEAKKRKARAKGYVKDYRDY